jgi:hypothetical protein
MILKTGLSQQNHILRAGPYALRYALRLCPTHDTPSGRRVFMHDAIMGLDSLEDKPMN